jgi:hypothetical protein
MNDKEWKRLEEIGFYPMKNHHKKSAPCDKKFEMNFQSLVQFHKENVHSHPTPRDDKGLRQNGVEMCADAVKISTTAFFLQGSTPR